jgi:hypothetical protein
MRQPQDRLSVTRFTNCSGDSRLAAPVGQALTQAGPPARSLHMSHFTACLIGSGALVAARLFPRPLAPDVNSAPKKQI